jgi:hypothetical protein
VPEIKKGEETQVDRHSHRVIQIQEAVKEAKIRRKGRMEE